MPTVYPSLAIGAPRRLALFRTEAKQTNWVRPMTWRDVRFAKLTSSTGMDSGINGKTPVWVSFDADALRRWRFADHVRNINHKGWFTDTDANETARGIVVALPHGRYLAGYVWTANDERVYFPEIFTDETDAARMADEHARVFAESAREDSERFDAMQDAETAVTEAETEFRECWARYKESQYSFTQDFYYRDLADSERETARDALAELRAARDALADATRAYERG